MTRRIFCKVLLVVVAIFGLLVISSILSAQGRSDDAFERVKAVQERHTDWLMAIDGVVGTAIGFNPNARLSVAVLLERPGVAGIPQELEGVAVHPVVTGEIYALAPPNGRGPKKPKDPVDPTSRFDRPVPIGVSTGHPAITAGTIACRVKDGGGNVYALSNNHVYANQNAASIGDDVLQPGTYDGGTVANDTIGTLADFEPIVFSTSANNVVDAAIALSSTSLLGNATPSDGYGTPKSATVAASINQKVKKYGRTTGLTKGQVYALNAMVNVNYGTEENPKYARFVNQIIIQPGDFSAGGDSGSLIVADGKGRNKEDDRKPVGLLFAGSFFFTIANPIDAVLDTLGVSIDGE